MMRDLVLRRATSGDAEAVADLYLSSRRAAGPLIPPSVRKDEEVRSHVRQTLIPHREVWLAEDERLLGVLVLDGSELQWLYVDPGAQRRGVGAALLRQAHMLRPQGLALWVFASNTPAREFYQRHGWRVVGGTDGDNEEGAPDLRMVNS